MKTDDFMVGLVLGAGIGAGTLMLINEMSGGTVTQVKRNDDGFIQEIHEVKV